MSKNIVLYSDEKYFEHALNTIESFRRVDDSFNFIYFQLGFEKDVFIYGLNIQVISLIEYPQLPYFILLKPYIFDLALKIVEQFIYVDIDLIASKNFDYNKMISKVEDKPFGCQLHDTEWQYPVYWSYDMSCYPQEKKVIHYSENNLMKHLGVKDRKQVWVTTCILAVNKSCKNFIKEWVSVCSDFQTSNKYYLPMGDETAYNVLLWKYDTTNYFEKFLIVEPKEIDTIIKIENSKIEKTQIENNNPITYVEDSEKVFVYHQLKDLDFRIKTLKKLYNA